MKKLSTYKEEFDTNIEEIRLAEKIWKSEFPKEFVEFLLEHNGVIIYPSYPKIKADTNWELWGIERMLSVKDIILQKKHLMKYTWNHEHEIEDLGRYNLSAENLLTFAVAERGCYYINLDRKDFGQLYFCCYQDWDGLVKIETNSFNEFIDSLFLAEKEYPELESFNINYLQHKIFDRRYFYTEQDPDLGLQRFKEIFSFFGNQQPPESGYRSIIQYYVDDRMKLDFLIEKGCSFEELLNYSRNAEIIKYLTENKGLDINKAYEGRFPMEKYTTTIMGYEVKVNYQLIDKILQMGIEIDWYVLDKTESTLIQRLKTLSDQYHQKEIDRKNWWIKNGKPSGHQPFPKSKWINELIKIEYER